METTDANEVVAVYTYGTDLIAMNKLGVNSFYHYDGLGSVIALSDSDGAVVETYRYDAFGVPFGVSSVGNPYLFTGRQFDAETGNYYYRARYYKPSIGRFLQTDPTYYSDGLNLYTYCHNDPINFTDPYGHGGKKWGDYWKMFIDWLSAMMSKLCPGSWVCKGSEACLKGCTAMYAHRVIVAKICENPDFIDDPNCKKLFRIIGACGGD